MAAKPSGWKFDKEQGMCLFSKYFTKNTYLFIKRKKYFIMEKSRKPPNK